MEVRVFLTAPILPWTAKRLLELSLARAEANAKVLAERKEKGK